MEGTITPTTEEKWSRRDDRLGQDLKRVVKSASVQWKEDHRLERHLHLF